MDGVELELRWSNAISIVSEQARALQRIAFSPIVREAGDLATALFDANARMIAQAITGTPGHINSLGAALPLPVVLPHPAQLWYRVAERLSYLGSLEGEGEAISNG
ncbi:MAG: hydantoinase B/oxoprolinase family protein [Pseudomonadota bacterium]